jgi:hypothetical protein
VRGTAVIDCLCVKDDERLCLVLTGAGCGGVDVTDPPVSGDTLLWGGDGLDGITGCVAVEEEVGGEVVVCVDVTVMDCVTCSCSANVCVSLDTSVPC